MMSAAAPSPKARSNSEPGIAKRVSAAITITRFAEPAFTASAAALRAVVPALREFPKSAVKISLRRSSARAAVTEICFSLYGDGEEPLRNCLRDGQTKEF